MELSQRVRNCIYHESYEYSYHESSYETGDFDPEKLLKFFFVLNNDTRLLRAEPPHGSGLPVFLFF